VNLPASASFVLIALVVGCGRHSGTGKESLADVEASGGYWAIRATCEGGRFEVDFGPKRLAAIGLGHASNDEIEVECGEPERVTVSDEELRNRAPTGAELTQPSYKPTKLFCHADGSLVVEAHPVWGSEGIVGAALRVERGELTILDGAVAREGYDLRSEVRWWHARCRPD
jgi:hypothetical protein